MNEAPEKDHKIFPFDFTIVMFATERFDPIELNPDNLRAKKIVHEDWQVVDIRLVEPFGYVSFETNIELSAQGNTISISEKNQKQPETSKIIDIASKFVSIYDEFKFRKAEIRFTGLVEIQNPHNVLGVSYLNKRIFKNKYGLATFNSIHLSYNLNDKFNTVLFLDVSAQSNMDIIERSSNEHKKLSVINAKASFMRKYSEEKKGPDIIPTKKCVARYWSDFVGLMSNSLTGSENDL